MNDLDQIKKENVLRRAECMPRYADYAAIETIDALVAEVQQLRAALSLPLFPGHDSPMKPHIYPETDEQ